MVVESQAGCVGNIGSGCLVQSYYDRLLRGVERRKDQERKFGKMDRSLVEGDAGGVGHGRTLEVGIDTCTNIRPQLALRKEKVEHTCSAVIDAFDPSTILAGRRSARLQEVVVRPKKMTRQDRQGDWVVRHQLGKSRFVAA
jgi:hypothetical protein